MKKHIFFVVSIFMCLSIDAVYANGYFETVGGTKEFSVNLDNSNVTNNVGAITQAFTWDLGDSYQATRKCGLRPIFAASIYYKATVGGNRPMSEYGHSFIKLNEYLDVKVEIFIAGNLNDYIAVPFNNLSNNYTSLGCIYGDASFIPYKITSGSKGRVTFRIRKKIINGVNVSNYEVVELFGRLGNTVSDFGPTPMARVVIKSAILYVPEKCVINEGQTIEVAFGEIGGRDLDGNKNEKTVPIRVRCEGGSFEGTHLNIAMAVAANPTAFGGGDYIKTDRKNLGIKLKQLDGSELKPNSFHPIEMHENIGEWGFIAAPISNNGQEINEGDFNATATIVSEIE
ncbi:fimbrial protein [Aeromonas finlandensis]|uniref:fimbrial protein n=1 Tax=Aeromonas finlandensis TaxID=1543375 RepID=UPI00051BB435|nr:fimbrial protein [Aeromonas finlandensis]